MLEAIAQLDAALLTWILALPHPPWLNAIVLAASWVGIGGAVWLGVAAALLVAGRIPWRDAVRLALAIALVHLVVDLLVKPWIDRPRPPLTVANLQPFADVPETRSFPSGHAANAAAAAVVLTRIWRQGRAVVWAAAAVVGIARVYLGIHYPFDAVAGGAVGALCGWVALRRSRAPSCL